MLFFCCEAFSGKIHRELFFLIKKSTISEKSNEIIRKLVLLNMFEKVKSWLKLGFVKTTLLDQTSKRGQNLKKKYFLLIVSLMQLNDAFHVVLRHFRWKIHRELLFLVKKVAISEKSTEILKKFVFLNMFQKGKYWLK